MSIVEVPSGDQPVRPDSYDAEYFLTECEGWTEFVHTKGDVLPERLSYAFSLGDIRPGMRVLDAGFGRGEMLLRCCRAGAHAFGVDYSPAAVELALDLLKTTTGSDAALVGILAADVKHLPFPDEYFHRVFALDIVEHLHPWELAQALSEIHRTLVPGGSLIVHTMPNRWYYAIGYPLFRAFQRLKGKSLPRDPRQRWRSTPRVHVNEQDPISLKKALQRADFCAKVWLRPVSSAADSNHSFEGLLKGALPAIFPLKLIFCSSIFAVATRRAAKGSSA